MICERTFDKDLVKSVLTDPEIFPRISEDGMTVDDMHIDVESQCVLSFYDEVLIGMFCLIPKSKVELDLHGQVFKKYRGKRSVEVMKLIFQYVLGTQYEKITTDIPVVYKDVMHYLVNMGFSREGINRRSFCKNGIIMDKVHFGITKDEMTNRLNMQ